MKQRCILCRRAGTFCCRDTTTGQQPSLRTKHEAEALTLLNAKNESTRQPVLNLQIARTYLTAVDPAFTQPTWQDGTAQMHCHGTDSTRIRRQRAMKSSACARLRQLRITETRAEDFLTSLNTGKVSVAQYLKRLHNLAISLGWLPVPVLAPGLWPKPEYKSKRGITLAEHQRILAAERNPERCLFYQLLWEVGASQSDAAALAAENIDRRTNTLTYFRMKTGEQAHMAISKVLTEILSHLPTTGPLFPSTSQTGNDARSAEFNRRCRLLGIQGGSLHTYRHAWAERARTCGYPERFAQEALGHNSKAVHRAYARKAQVTIPTLEEFEQKMKPVFG